MSDEGGMKRGQLEGAGRKGRRQGRVFRRRKRGAFSDSS